MPINEEKAKALFKAGSDKYDLGSYEEFKTKIELPEKRKALYETMSKDYDLGSYEEYESKLSGDSVKKKRQTKLQPSGDYVRAAPKLVEPLQKNGLQQLNDPQQNVPQPEKESSLISNVASSFDRGMTEFIPSTLETIGAVTNQIDKGISSVVGGKASGYENQPATIAAKKVREGMDYLFPVDNKFKESFTGQIAQGLGQVSGMALSMPLGAATGAVASASMAAPQVFSSEYKQAKQKGADDETAFGVGLVNMIGGTALEVLPIANAFKRIDKISGGQIKKALINTAKGTAEEAITEGLQTTFSNLTAQQTYDKNRELLDGVQKSSEVGGATGFILNGLLNSLGVKLKRTKLDSAKPKIEQAIAETEQAIQANIDVEQQTTVNEPTTTEPITNDAVAETQTTSVPEEIPTPTEQLTENMVGVDINVDGSQPVSDISQQQRTTETGYGQNTTPISEGLPVSEGVNQSDSQGVDSTIPEWYDPNAKTPKVAHATQPIGNENYRKKEHKKGRTITKTIPDGSKLKGTYKIVSADDVLASHNEQTFSKTEGFPINESGKTINDRDYEKDKTAQSEVSKIAQKLDDRAIDQTPVVTKDGIVLDGNNRTMSRKLAAKLGTDKVYLEGLKEKAEMYGFEMEDIDGVKNPMLIFEPNDDIGYNTKEMAKFNKTEKKEKSPIEKAVELSKTVSDRARRVLADVYSDASSQSEITSDPVKSKKIKNLLIDEGILSTNEQDRYFNPDSGTINKEGVAFMETFLLGSSLDENTIRTLDSDGMGGIRNKIVSILPQITQNASLGKNSLVPNIQNAIELLNKAKASKSSILDAIAQFDAFETVKYSPEDLAMAVILNEKGSKEYIQNYNSNVDTESVFDGKLTKDKLIEDILKAKIKNYEQVRKNLRSNEPTAKSDIPKSDGSSNKKGGEKIDSPKRKFVSKEFRDTSKSSEQLTAEINSKNTTRVYGLGMGSGVAKGTYISTESNNRYSSNDSLPQPVKVKIKNPFVIKEGTVSDLRNTILGENVDKFNEFDFAEGVIIENPTIDDLSDGGTEKLAGIVTEKLQQEGYDSLYFPESNTQEGELAVFDNNNVDVRKEQPNAEKPTDKLKSVVKNMSIPEFIGKHGKEFKSKEEATDFWVKERGNTLGGQTEANKAGIGRNSLISNGFIGFDMPNLDKVLKETKEFITDKFTRNGNLPMEAFMRRLGVKAEIDANITRVRFAVNKLNTAVNQYLKTTPIKNQINVEANIQVAIQDMNSKEFNDLPQEVKEAIVNMREHVDGLTDEMFSLGMITDEMKPFYEKNKGIYLTRSFQKWDNKDYPDDVDPIVYQTAYNLIIGQIKSNNIDSQIKSDKLKTELESTITTNEDLLQTGVVDKEISNLEKANKFLEEQKKAKLLPEQIQSINGKILANKSKIQAYVDNEPQYYQDKIDKAQKRLDKIKDIDVQRGNKDEAFYRNQTETIINKLLDNPSSSSLKQSGKIGSVSASFWKKRKDIEEPIRALMGEHKDARLNYANTIVKMVNAVANYRYLSDLKAMGEGKWLFKPNSNAPSDFSYPISTEASKSMQPISGYTTSKDIRDAMQKVDKMNEDGTFMKAYYAVLARIKFGKTVLNPSTIVANYVANPFFLIRNGNFNNWGEAHRLIIDNLQSKGTDQRQKELLKLTKLGIVGNSANKNELSNIYKDSYDKSPEELLQKQIEALSKGYENLGEKAAKIYGGIDDVFKIVNFYGNVDTFRKAYPNMPIEEIETMAANITLDEMPSYDRAWKIGNQLAKTPFANFPTFTSEVVRTQINSSKRMANELMGDNKVLKEHAVKRLAGTVASYFAVGAASLLSKSLLGVTEKDEEKIKKTLPIWSKESNGLVFLSKPKNGQTSIVDLNRFDPNAYIGKGAHILYEGMSGERDKQKAINDFVMNAIEPFVGLNLAVNLGEQLNNNQDRYNQKIYLEDDSNAEKGYKIGMFITKEMSPGFVQAGLKNYYAWTDQSKGGKTFDKKEEALSIIGIKPVSVDMNKDFSFAATKKDKGYRDRIQSVIDDYAKHHINNELNVLDSEENAHKKIRKVVAEANEKYRNALYFGSDNAKLNTALIIAFKRQPMIMNAIKTNGELTKQQLDFLINKKEVNLLKRKTK